MSTAPSAETKLRTLAMADSNMQAIFGQPSAFRWFDLQLAQQSVAKPVTPVSSNPVYMAVHRVSTSTVRNQGGVTDLEQVRLQLTIISYSSENAKQAAVAVKNFMNTISLVDNGLLSSPVTTPTQNPNSLLNQRSGMLQQLHPPAYSYMQDWRIYNRTDVQTAPTPPLPPSVGVVLTTDATAGLTSLSWRGASFFYSAQPNPSFVNVIQSDGTHLTTTPTSRSTDPVTNTTTQTFPWGTATTQYTASGDNLLVTVTIQNSTGLDITKYWMFPLGLAFPSMPGTINSNAAFNMDSPSSIFNTYSIGGNDLVNEDFNSPVAMGYWPTASPVNANWFVSLYVDPQHSLNNSWPPIIRPIVAGSSVTFNLSVRFGASGSTELSLAGNVFTRFGATYPKQTLALDKTKPIARLSFTSNVKPFSSTNPRGWFNDPTVDVTTPSGVAAFQTRLLGAANSAIAEMTRMGVSGGILWDMEGQEFQSGISYIGDPSQAETLAPELVGVLDTFVNKFKAAGFRIGFTLRPQVFANTTGVVDVSGTSVTWVSGSQFSSAWAGDPTGGFLTVGTNNYAIVSATATSITLATSAGNLTGVPYAYPTQTYPVDPHAVLDSKAQYAVNRWGASMFYCDSTVYDNAVTPAAAFQRLAQTYPGTLYIPEWKQDEHYAYSLPWIDPRLPGGATAPGQRVNYSYPTAQGAVYVANDSPSSSFIAALTASVQGGNVIIFDGWFRHPANDVILAIYQSVYP